jgi:hypothetical protein
VKLVGRELALRYVLEGSMREVANRVAITMQLMHRARPARTRDNLRYSTHLRRIRRNFGFLVACWPVSSAKGRGLGFGRDLSRSPRVGGRSAHHPTEPIPKAIANGRYGGMKTSSGRKG